MANEGRVQFSLSMKVGNKHYRPRAFTFQISVAGTAGPLPGTVIATTAGVNVDLSGLSELGGWCTIQNYDDTNYVTFGVWDGATFYPLGELLPGEGTGFRLSRILLYGESGTALVNQLRLVADTADCEVQVEAHDP